MYAQCNFAIKDNLNKGHLSNEDNACSPTDIELCANLSLTYGRLSIQDSQPGPNGASIERFRCKQDSQPGPNGASIERFRCKQDSQLGPNGVLYREVPLYTGHPAGSQWCPL